MNIIKTFVLSFFMIVISFSQESDNVIGKKIVINSKILKENRDVQIYFPTSYDTTKTDYPVLYILDGQNLFLHGVSVLKSFQSPQNISPEFIVVGINNKYPDRFNHFSGTKFLDFIETEVVSHIDKNYRTNSERIIYGWEFAGAFALNSMITRPHLFTGHIIASPYPVHVKNDNGKSKIDLLEEKLKAGFSSYLYFAVSEGEGMVEDGTKELSSMLKTKAPNSLRWKYRVIPDEQHPSTALATLYQGLKSYYNNYEVFAIYGLDKFKKAGGLKHFYKYNKERTKRFGFSENPEPWSMYSIV